MTAKKAAKRTPRTSQSEGFSDVERAAMKARAKELKASARQADEESAVLAELGAMSEPDRTLGKKLHALIKATAPALSPRLWYGMPAYAKDGKIVCFFQGAQKFKTRYATLGFSENAQLDDGNMWPTAFALKQLTRVEEARIIALVKQALA